VPEEAMNLYIRLLRLLLKILFIKKQNALEPSVLTFRAWPHDCDLYLHMTNSRYSALMDLGRTHLIAQAGLIRKLIKKKFLLVPVSSELSYIREIKPFQKFQIHSQIIAWDETYWFVEQRFVCGETIHALAMVRGLVLKGREKIPFQKVVDLLDFEVEKPPMPSRVLAWKALLEEKKK
jgi:acyl-CoA thioesterase FadM